MSQIKHHLSANADMKKRHIMLGNFLGGLAWGVGTVVGATVVVASMGSILHALGLLDFIKQFTIYYK